MSEPPCATEKTTDFPSGEIDPSCAPSVPEMFAGVPPAVGTSASCCVSPEESASTCFPSGEIESVPSEAEPSFDQIWLSPPAAAVLTNASPSTFE